MISDLRFLPWLINCMLFTLATIIISIGGYIMMKNQFPIGEIVLGFLQPRVAGRVPCLVSYVIISRSCVSKGVTKQPQNPLNVLIGNVAAQTSASIALRATSKLLPTSEVEISLDAAATSNLRVSSNPQIQQGNGEIQNPGLESCLWRPAQSKFAVQTLWCDISQQLLVPRVSRSHACIRPCLLPCVEYFSLNSIFLAPI